MNIYSNVSSNYIQELMLIAKLLQNEHIVNYVVHSYILSHHGTELGGKYEISIQ